MYIVHESGLAFSGPKSRPETETHNSDLWFTLLNLSMYRIRTTLSATWKQKLPNSRLRKMQSREEKNRLAQSIKKTRKSSVEYTMSNRQTGSKCFRVVWSKIKRRLFCKSVRIKPLGSIYIILWKEVFSSFIRRPAVYVTMYYCLLWCILALVRPT